MNTKNVTTLHNFDHQEGHFTEQCVIFASKEEVKRILGERMDEVGYAECVALLVDRGIAVRPVIGLAADGFNGGISDMEEWKEDAPGFHFDGRPIMELRDLYQIYDQGKDKEKMRLEEEETMPEEERK
jgi:hypothetical protein